MVLDKNNFFELEIGSTPIFITSFKWQYYLEIRIKYIII